MSRGSWIFLVIIAVAAGVLALTGGGKAPTPKVFEARISLAEAEALSAQRDRPVLAFFTADWCGPCQAMKRGALVDERVVAAIGERTVPVYLDVTRANQGDPAARGVMARYGVRALPTLIVLRGEDQLARAEGALNAGAVLALLDEAEARRGGGGR